MRKEEKLETAKSVLVSAIKGGTTSAAGGIMTGLATTTKTLPITAILWGWIKTGTLVSSVTVVAPLALTGCVLLGAAVFGAAKYRKIKRVNDEFEAFLKNDKEC